MSSPGTNAEKNQTAKRRKIEIKQVEQIDRRNVTFSKRKLGLFNKLTELSILCKVDTAMIITSQNGKFYSCGYPNADAVIGRYVKRESSPQPLDHASKKKEQEMIKTLRLEYEATQNQLKEEKKRLQEITETQKGSSGFLPWWNLSTEGMSLENVEQFKNSLERLRSSLVAAFQGKQLNAIPSMPSSCAIAQSVTSFVGVDNVYPPQKTIMMIEPNRTIVNVNSSISSMVPPISNPIFSPMQSAMVPPMAHNVVPTSQFANMSMLAQNFNGNQVQECCNNGAGTSSHFM